MAAVRRFRPVDIWPGATAWFAVLLGLPVSAVTGAAAVEPSPAVAILRDFTGPVFLRAAEGGFEMQLRPHKDFNRSLHEGETLRSAAGASAHVWFGSALRIVTAANSPLRIHRDQSLTPQQQAEIEVLRAYAEPGASRGIGTAVWSPARMGAVRTTTATILWNESREPLTFSIARKAGGSIWSAPNVDGLTGRLTPPQAADLRHALSTIQSATGNTELLLTVTGQVQQTIPFFILPRSIEAALDRQLQACDQELTDPVLRSLARAGILVAAEVYPDALQEMQSVMASEPESEDVLRSTLSMAGRAGHVALYRQLQMKLTASGM